MNKKLKKKNCTYDTRTGREVQLIRDSLVHANILNYFWMIFLWKFILLYLSTRIIQINYWTQLDLLVVFLSLKGTLCSKQIMHFINNFNRMTDNSFYLMERYLMIMLKITDLWKVEKYMQKKDIILMEI